MAKVVSLSGERLAFVAANGVVWWSPSDQVQIKLGERQVEALFEIFAAEDSHILFDQLNAANVAGGGIERVSPFRRRAA